VPEVIAKIIETKIRLWVLTGDKQETAIEIAKSCKLIQQDMEILILTSSSSEEFKSKLHNYTKKSLEFNEGELPPI
jgi:phospholipid-transporting ATPase